MRALVIPCLAAGLLAIGCDDGSLEPTPDAGASLPAEYVIGVLDPPGSPEGAQPELDFAVERINALGGIMGRAPLVLRRRPTSADDTVEVAAALAAEDDVVAVIGPGVSADLLDVARVVSDAGKPLIVPYATSGELQRAFAGSKFVWRTKASDIGQTEFILREARAAGATRIALLAGLGEAAQSYFNWFGFYATHLGFAADDVYIATYGQGVPAGEALRPILDARPDVLVVAANGRPDLPQIAQVVDAARRPDGELPFRVVLADTGIDVPTALELEPGMVGWGGYTTTAAEQTGFRDALAERGGAPSGAAAGHDAVLLLAYGLEAAGGDAAALADGIATVVEGDGPAHPATEEGIGLTLAAIRAGERPDVQGVASTFDFDPVDGVDPVAPTLGEWVAAARADGAGARYRLERTIDLAAERLSLRRGRSAFTAPVGGAGTGPMAPPERIVALILTASSGWDNYRHQADALRQYHRLRDMGVPDDDIVMVGADDLVEHPLNPLPGVVRNVPGGEDVYRDVVYDYPTLTPDQIVDVLTGTVTESTPVVVPADEDSLLYVYLAGHGGIIGMVMDADTTEAGLAAVDIDSVLQPMMFTETLCGLRADGRLPRAMIAIESCSSGVFGEAAFGGIEAGCADGETTLDDVLLFTASNALENSLGAGYDRELDAWVGDEFSVAFAARIEDAMLGSMLDVYRDVYQSVSGSHVSAYNTALTADLGLLPAAVMLRLATDE